MENYTHHVLRPHMTKIPMEFLTAPDTPATRQARKEWIQNYKTGEVIYSDTETTFVKKQ